MRRTNFVKQALIAFLVLIINGMMVFDLHATDGYFSLGYGTKNKGVAGAGVGYYHYSLINGNPAGNVYLGKKITLGVAIFSPNRKYTVRGNPSGIPGFFGLTPGTIESDSKIFIIPNLGFNWSIGADKKSAFGIAIFGNGGMNTDYPTQAFYDPTVNTTGVNLAQLFGNFTYSREFAEGHSFGLTATVAYQMFEAKGLASFAGFSSDATKLANNGSDNSLGFGFKFGYMGRLSDAFTFGLTFQSKTVMGEFEDYAGLFAEQGDFDIPATWTAGFAWAANDKLTLMFDVKQILYSGVNSISNPMDLRANAPTDQMGNPNPNFQPLGADNAWGFGWEDMTIVKFGLELSPNENMTWRAGYSYGTQPVQTSEVLFNILAPGIVQNHLALGFSKKVGSKNEFHLSLNYAFNQKVSGFNPLDFDGAELQMGNFVPNQTIDLEMKQFDIEVGFSF